MSKLLVYGERRRWAALAALVLAVALVLCGCGKNSKYEKLYRQAQELYDAGDCEGAAEALNAAIELKPTEEAYLLLSDVYYYGLEDIDSAIDTLYAGTVRISGQALSQRLEELKAERTGELGGRVIIGAKDLDSKAVSVVLSDMELKDEDIRPLAGFDQLESLTVEGNYITDLSPLSELENLTSLFASRNRIEDLSPLKSLAQLRTLYLDGNPIKDFSPLYGLTQLRTLSIKDLDIDADALAALRAAMPWCSIHCDEPDDGVEELSLGGVTFMSDVEELNLAGLGITDISELAKCTKLRTLDLRNNQISDLSPLSGLTELSWLCLWNNSITDIMPLVSLKGLEYLDLDKNNIESAAGLVSMSALQELWMSDNRLDDISSLSYLKSLKRLGLKNNQLDDGDLDVIMRLTSLEELKLEGNEALTAEKLDELKDALPDCSVSHSEVFYTVTFGGTAFTSDSTEIDAANRGVTDIGGLAKFTALTTLRLGGNLISDISPLSELTRMEVLDLSGNGISDLGALSGMSRLRRLDVSSNVLGSIAPLASCTALQQLCVDDNPLAGISAVSSLTALTEFSAAGCGLSDISALEALRSLKTLHLENNWISDLSALRGLSSLQELYIGENALTADQVLALQEALPGCTIHTDLDLSRDAEGDAAGGEDAG